MVDGFSRIRWSGSLIGRGCRLGFCAKDSIFAGFGVAPDWGFAFVCRLLSAASL